MTAGMPMVLPSDGDANPGYFGLARGPRPSAPLAPLRPSSRPAPWLTAAIGEEGPTHATAARTRLNQRLRPQNLSSRLLASKQAALVAATAGPAEPAKPTAAAVGGPFAS